MVRFLSCIAISDRHSHFTQECPDTVEDPVAMSETFFTVKADLLCTIYDFLHVKIRFALFQQR